MDRRERTYRTLRLVVEDKELLQRLGRNDQDLDRYHALLELVAVVQKLKLPDVRNQIRHPLRLGIPTQLDKAIRKKADATGQTYIAILLTAAREHLDTPPRQ